MTTHDDHDSYRPRPLCRCSLDQPPARACRLRAGQDGRRDEEGFHVQGFHVEGRDVQGRHEEGRWNEEGWDDEGRHEKRRRHEEELGRSVIPGWCVSTRPQGCNCTSEIRCFASSRNDGLSWFVDP